MSHNDEPEISEKAWRLLSENRIEAALADGEFVDLPGFGKPVSSIDQQVEAELAQWRAKRDSEAIESSTPPPNAGGASDAANSAGSTDSSGSPNSAGLPNSAGSGAQPLLSPPAASRPPGVRSLLTAAERAQAPRLTVCGVQMDVQLGQVASNLARIGELGAAAAARGARAIVFPECALTGYGFDSAESVAQVALTPDSHELQTLADWSRQWSAAILVGTAWREADGRLRNAVLTFDQGRWIDTYFKVHLPWMGLDRFVVPGEHLHQPIEIGGAWVGIHICYEGGFPEVARSMALAGADLVVLPTNWPPGSGVSCRVIPSCRALENRVYFMAVNRVGEEAGFRFIGNSSWSHPNGVEAERLSESEEGYLTAIIDTAEARQKRLVIQAGSYEVDRIADRHPALYHSLTAEPPTS